MRCLSLFSGIGGLDIAAEAAGMRTVAFCEQDTFCRRALAAHWPGVPIYDDVRDLTAARLAADGIEPVDLIHGGFPCQDISNTGKRAGITGERSGLWSEFARAIGELRPAYAVVENVAALLGRGLDRVLGDLSEIGYDAEWSTLRASDVGAPHRRERLFIVAYPHRLGRAPMHLFRPGAEIGREARARGWLQSSTHSGSGGGVRLFPDGGLHGMADGRARGLDRRRIKALGNAVVPAQAYPVFAAIAAYEKEIA